MAPLTGSSSVEIDAPIERCWAIVEDVPTAPEWQGGLERMDVIERDDQGRALVCEAVTDAKVKKVVTPVRFTYEPPTKLSWEQVGKGDLKYMRGAWTLEDLGNGRTKATYDVEVDLGRLGFVLRGPIVDGVRAVVINPRPKELAAAVKSGG
jgi:ribosome-associated toxin RatA of RatAB toxin-antitoxin module